jgi:hypothetical protein
MTAVPTTPEQDDPRRMSPEVAERLFLLLTGAGNAANAAARMLAGCVCGHDEASHGLDRHGRRTACSVATGPAGTPCPCPAWAPLSYEPTAQPDPTDPNPNQTETQP